MEAGLLGLGAARVVGLRDPVRDAALVAAVDEVGGEADQVLAAALDADELE